MKILYIVTNPPQINTSSSIRNKATMKGLLELGHDVHLVTTQYDPNHQNYDDESMISLNTDHFQATYISVGGVQNAIKLGRKIPIPKFMKELLFKQYLKIVSRKEIYDTFQGIVRKQEEVKDIEQYDIIISSSDPKSSHLFASELLKPYKDKIWIQIWGDPFLTDITLKNKRLAHRIKREENRLLSLATRVIYVSALTAKSEQSLYPENASKMFFVPSPYFETKIYETDQPKEKDSYTFLYCGDYYQSVRNIMPLYQAISQSNHRLIICGSTDLNLKPNAHVTVYPRLPFHEIKKFEAECDVLVHVSNLRGSQIPGKIYQYSGTNKPILFLLDGDKESIRKNFEKYNRYQFCDNEQAMIEKSLAESPIWINQSQQPIIEFSPKEVAAAILKTLDE